jgi:hypothetical protein
MHRFGETATTKQKISAQQPDLVLKMSAAIENQAKSATHSQPKPSAFPIMEARMMHARRHKARGCVSCHKRFARKLTKLICRFLPQKNALSYRLRPKFVEPPPVWDGSVLRELML